MRWLSLLSMVCFSLPAIAQREFGFDNRKGSGQPYLTPAETVQRMKVPPEFDIKLFAGEPDCVNPIAFTIDEKGRVWVVECFEYPSRTPPGKAPRDRIVILEDTDGDGACDKRTVFAEGKDFPVSEARKAKGLGAFDLASGIEVGHGGVFVGAPPYLWFIENKNDKPGKFETLLSGFGSEDTHETLNTFQWGPDGWLYGLHGVFTQSNVKSLDGPETRMNAAVWRYHPVQKKFEIFAEGTSNPWGMDWRNSDGEFILACCVIPHLYHIVPGAVYKRQAGANENPYVFGSVPEICDHTFHRESGWAHAGLISLDVPHIPEKYRNSVIFGSIHGCSIKQNILKPNGSSFKASRGDDFLVSGDKNFRPINMKWGPHGDIYLIDWHDQNPCHQAKASDWDYERGRVYRIELKGRKGGKPANLTAANDDPPSVGLTDPYARRTALRLAYERFAPKPMPVVNTPRLKSWTDIQALHALGSMTPFRDGHTESTAHAAKAWQVRLTSQMKIEQEDLKSLVGLAKETPNATVRRELASAALRMTAQHDTTALLTALAGHGEDADDPLIPHLVWLAWEQELTKQHQRDGFQSDRRTEAVIDQMVADAPGNRLVRDHLLPKTIRRMAITGEANALRRCVEIVARLNDVNSREKALDGIALALQGRTVDMPENWPAIVKDLRAEPKLAKYADALAVAFRDPEAVKRSFTVMRDTTQPDAARAEAIRQLTMLKPANVHKAFVTIIKQDFPEAVKIEAARGLSTFDDASLPSQMIGLWPVATPAVRSELVSTLASRKSGAKELLAAMKAGTIDRTLATDQIITRIQAFNDRELNALIESAWGRTRKTPVELQRLIDKTRDEIGMTPASFERGRVQFETQCAKCHQFEGKGQSVGPALDGAGRDIDYIITNVIDPNRVIGAPYFLRTAQLADGKIEQGVLAEEDDKFITLKTENGVLKKIAKADLDGPVRVVEKSMMPEGLTAGMKPADFRDLVRYLMANPFVCEVTVNGEAMRAGANGKILLPGKAGEVKVAFSVTSPKALTTTLLVGCTDDVSVSVGGKVVGSVKGSVRRPSPDQGQIPITLAAGSTTVTVTIRHAAASDAIYLRLVDPDRLLRYPGE